MANNFIPTLPRHTLYCVWIATGDPRRPLECIWIDPEFRSFHLMDSQQMTTPDGKTLSAERFPVSVPADELLRETPLAIRPLALVLDMICFLVAAAGAAPFCFGQGHLNDLHVTPRVVRDSAPSDVRPRYAEAPPFRASADLVLVPVTVTDQRERLVVGLERDNFSVYDESAQQVIRHISAEDAPLSLGIIFDTSSSMYGKMERSRDAVVQFLRSANPDDEFFLIGVADRPELLVDSTSSVEDIQDAISRATPEGATALLDAVYLGLETMRRARNERKVLLIISDGGENHSRYNIREVCSVVREAGVQIYAMGIFDDAPKTNAERSGPVVLTAISSLTGGRVFPIHSLKKIVDAANELAIQLRNQYLIAYHPSALAHDGKWHRISVRINPPQNSPRLRVYAKGGYYAPAE
jgi:Ca-activated chloride channel family protein